MRILNPEFERFRTGLLDGTCAICGANLFKHSRKVEGIWARTEFVCMCDHIVSFGNLDIRSDLEHERDTPWAYVRRFLEDNESRPTFAWTTSEGIWHRYLEEKDRKEDRLLPRQEA